MGLNICSLSIVKALGLGYPSTQIVFLRAIVGLIIMSPWIWHQRAAFRRVEDLPLHLLRVVFSTCALSLSFFAMPRLPFALVSAIGFTRPALTMALAVLVLGERVGRGRWIAAGIAFVGVLIAVNPAGLAFTWGLPAMFGAVLAGVSAVIVTRRLSRAPIVVLMAFYTAGLSLLTAPIAITTWVPIAPEHLIPLLAIGCFAQGAQACFIRAHRMAEAGFLSVLSYLSLILTTLVGYVIFAEVPNPGFWVGAALIVGAAVVLRKG